MRRKSNVRDLGGTHRIRDLVEAPVDIDDIQISASPRILALDTGAPANAKELTLSQVLDFVGSAANGDILYRTGGAWARLAVGGNGNVLTVASSLPSWASPAGTPITRQILASGSSATYTTPANCKKLIIKMIGGGAGAGAATTNNGANGNTTTFDGVSAAGGIGGTHGAASTNTSGGTGGTGGAGSATLRLPGSSGGYGFGTLAISGFGGVGLYGTGGAIAIIGTAAGLAGGTNTGAGGSGGSAGAATGEGGGGGGGEYVELERTTPAATYTYTVAASAAGGSAGSQAGGAGGSGLIIVEEYY